MSWGSDQLGVTEETFEMVKAATSGVLTSTGIAGIDLDDLISLVPVDVPFFNSTPRRPAKQGALFSFWQALLNVNASQPDGGVQADYAAPLAQVSNQYMYAPFASVGSGGTVSYDALAQGQNYADVLAVDTLQSINQQLISLDMHQLLAQAYALPTVGTPTGVGSATGGSIATGTVYFKVAARSGMNYYRGGSGVASSEGSASVTSGGSTGSVAAKVTAVKGAVAYDWYVGSVSGTEYYYTTTTTNTVTITSVPGSTQNVPALSGIYHSGQAGPSSVPAADTSYQTYWQNGLLPSVVGDFSASLDQLGGSSFSVAGLVTPGSGTSQGAYYVSLDGASLSVNGAALTEIDTMNRAIYDTYQTTPTRLLMGSQSINDIANAILDNPQAITWLTPTDAEGRARVVAGGAVAIYLNKTVNGKPITLELQPHLPPGTIIAVVDEVNFPGANIATAIEVETLYDFFRFDYGANRVAATSNGGPRYDFEVRTRQALKVKASPVFGVMQNIGAGVA